VLRTFEYDDYPWKAEQLFDWADAIKRQWPNFRMNVFAIAELMEWKHWKPLWKRRDWMRVGMHGFIHRKRECRTPRHYRDRLHILDECIESERWAPMFKAPWYGMSGDFCNELDMRGIVGCTKTFQYDWPYPMREWKQWNLHDRTIKVLDDNHLENQWRTALCLDTVKHDVGVHVVAHPRYEGRQKHKSGKTEINKRHTTRWTRFWSPDDEFAFVDDLAESALVKLNLGCGPDVWDGWQCLDPRGHIPGVRRWSFAQQIPYGDCRADIIVTSHVFNYLADEEYEAAMLEIWRVLRPGGVWRMQEDRTDNGYVWRRPGEGSRGTGEIKSLPTRQKIYEVAKRIGFTVHNSEPGITRSPHLDVLQGDNRLRRWRLGHKFYAEAIKDDSVLRPNRPRLFDPRAKRRGRYKMPKADDN
jgi:predicted SAM-dependent methyltransferase